MSETSLADYPNRTGRPTGSFVRLAGRVLPGIASVQRQVGPYAAAWHAANLDALTRRGPRWIVLGDSMSQGVGASSFSAGWVNQVQQRLTEDGRRYEVVNLSASGARVEDVLTVQLPLLDSLPPRADDDPQPDLVTVLIGSNDLIRRRYREELPQRFAEMLRRLPSGTVVATLPNPRLAATQVNILITRAQAARRVIAADLRSGGAGSWRGKLAEDHFHPNDGGYADLAEVFYHAIGDAPVPSVGLPPE